MSRPMTIRALREAGMKFDFVGGASAQDVADKIQASWASLN